METIDKFDPSVMSGQPAIPNTSLAGVWAELIAEQAVVQAGASLMAAAELSNTLSLAAGEAAAFDEFQVSMGSPEEAQAAMKEAVAQLNASIAQLVDGVNQALSGAWTSQQTAWAQLSAGITASQTAFTADLAQAATEADKIQSALDDGMVDIVFAQTDAYWAEVELRGKILTAFDNYAANGRNVAFDNTVAGLNSRWWNGTFFVGGSGAASSGGPWYNDSAWDWVNPFAWIASALYGIKDALAGGYGFLTKDHGAYRK